MNALLVIALLPTYLIRFSLFGIPTTVLEILLLIVIGQWLCKNHRRIKSLFRIPRTWAIAIALIVIAATVSAIITPNAFSGLGIWKAYFIEPILFFYLLLDELKQKKITVDQILFALVLGGFVPALTAIAQWIFNAGIPIPWDIERRVTGVFDYPNALGLYLGPLIVIAVGTLKKNKLFFAIALVLFSIAIILAQSEAAIAATIITVVLMGIAQPSLRKKTLIISVMAVGLIFVIPQTRAFLIPKLTLQDYSGQIRIGQWSETLELLKNRPLLGAGLSGYPEALKPYHTQTHIEIFQYPHTIFLNIWVELGLLGLASFLIVATLLLRSLPILLPTSYFLLPFPLLQTFLHGLVDVPYFKNDLAIMTWVFLSVFLYAIHLQKSQNT